MWHLTSSLHAINTVTERHASAKTTRVTNVPDGRYTPLCWQWRLTASCGWQSLLGCCVTYLEQSDWRCCLCEVTFIFPLLKIYFPAIICRHSFRNILCFFLILRHSSGYRDSIYSSGHSNKLDLISLLSTSFNYCFISITTIYVVWNRKKLDTWSNLEWVILLVNTSNYGIWTLLKNSLLSTLCQ